MPRTDKFFIDGHWVAPADPSWFDLIDPATEAKVDRLAMGNAEDVDRAVKAAQRAFPAYAETTVAQRIALLKRICDIYEGRQEEFAEAIRLEMGSPITISRKAQVVRGPMHLKAMIEVLENFKFEESRSSSWAASRPTSCSTT